MREDQMINGLDKYFERQEKAKILRTEKTPEKQKAQKSAKKSKCDESRMRETWRDTQDGLSSKRGNNLEDMIIVLHKQLHSMKI